MLNAGHLVDYVTILGVVHSVCFHLLLHGKREDVAEHRFTFEQIRHQAQENALAFLLACVVYFKEQGQSPHQFFAVVGKTLASLLVRIQVAWRNGQLSAINLLPWCNRITQKFW